jgi:hypothetical protein
MSVLGEAAVKLVESFKRYPQNNENYVLIKKEVDHISNLIKFCIRQHFENDPDQDVKKEAEKHKN